VQIIKVISYSFEQIANERERERVLSFSLYRTDSVLQFVDRATVTVSLWILSSLLVSISQCVNLYCWNLDISYRGRAVLGIFNNFHQNLCHSLHENTDWVHCYIDNMTKHFDYLVCEQWHKDLSFWLHWYVLWQYLILRDELRIFEQVTVFCL